MNSHLSDDQLIDRLYGIGADEDTRHMNGCEPCRARMETFRERWKVHVATPPPTAEFLRGQRKAIQVRLEKSERNWARVWVPASAAALLIVGFVLQQPETAPSNSAKAEVRIETGWFEDTYSAMSEVEPRAASPIRGLFNEPVAE